MTPHEKAVIQAAIRWYEDESDLEDNVVALAEAVRELLKSKKPRARERSQ